MAKKACMVAGLTPAWAEAEPKVGIVEEEDPGLPPIGIGGPATTGLTALATAICSSAILGESMSNEKVNNQL